MLLLDWRRGSGIGLARLQRATQVLAGAAWETSIGEWGTDRGRSAGPCAVSGLSALDRARVEKRQVGWQGIGAGDALQVRPIIDAFSRTIVGWRVASHMRTTMVLDGIEMARWSRGTQLTGLRCHSDAGSQFTSIRYGERLAEIGATPSIGTVADSYDNALAETVNGYYKAELIRGPAREGRPWKTVEDVELATLSWVHWHNNDRLHGYLHDVPPAEFEATFYATKRADQTLVGIQ
ncbi:hypothetical protein NCCP2495_11450 [Dietzia sp. NCCP-2495]|uniref:DDE-type integrase/transposase/recombinase n=1 Tax=Dietzia sp. NCCP-2495 TaxID=2934675 RepID=UPI00280E1E6D|nr:DDE-type integrase/transposase/recombinase [Dietzia sp. NCCP-2495]GLB63267.1 hypothetical protein NCCP2495_11450 [Dietzia sp. NCCP-2495]